MRRTLLVIEVSEHMVDNSVFDEETLHQLSELSEAQLEFE